MLFLTRLPTIHKRRHCRVTKFFRFKQILKLDQLTLTTFRKNPLNIVVAYAIRSRLYIEKLSIVNVDSIK